MNQSEETIAEINGVELCFQTFGEDSDPALLLVGGSSASMDWWPAELCERLAAGGRFVVRYDHRDTGRSTTYPVGEPGYTSQDLDADAAGLLAELGIDSAHLVGLSMGGGIIQTLARQRPELVRSLTLIATASAFDEPGEPELPGMSEETIAAFSIEPPDLGDRAAAIDYITHLARVSASPEREFEEDDFRELAGTVFDRSKSIAASLTNHDAMLGASNGADAPGGRLADLDVPALVIHGREDPVLPLPHGEALAERLPDAELLVLERTGHEIPRHTWDRLVEAILDHTGSARAQSS